MINWHDFPEKLPAYSGNTLLSCRDALCIIEHLPEIINIIHKNCQITLLVVLLVQAFLSEIII